MYENQRKKVGTVIARQVVMVLESKLGMQTFGNHDAPEHAEALQARA